jgi:hypothetical protein
MYDSITTIIEQNNYINNNNDTPQWILQTEWPDGSIVQSVADNMNIIRSSSSSSSSKPTSKRINGIQFTTYSRVSSKKSTATTKRIDDLFAENNNDKRVRPKSRTSLIKFGSSPESEKGKFGSLESYSYTFNNNNNAYKDNDSKINIDTDEFTSESEPSVRYTRYGEGPVWYGPGRMCLLELKGRLVYSSSSTLSQNQNDDATTTIKKTKKIQPPTIAQSTAAYIPKFWDLVHTDLGRHHPVTAITQEEPVSKGGIWRFLLSKPRRGQPITTSASSNSIDDRNFKYYSDALAQYLFCDDNENESSDDEDITGRKTITTTRTVDEYRKLYNDLKIRRLINKFRTRPLIEKQLAQSLGIRTKSKHGVLQPLYTFEGYDRNNNNNEGTKNAIINKAKDLVSNIKGQTLDIVDKVRSLTSFTL